MTYIAYLDEFGHIGPYIARDDPRHNDSPVFGLAGFIMPLKVVRGFGTWFYQRKCDLLDFEIQRSGEHPAVWEKKGSSLYTVRNVTQYPELRQTTFRLLNKIQNLGGRVFYFVSGRRRIPVTTRRTPCTRAYWRRRSGGSTFSAAKTMLRLSDSC